MLLFVWACMWTSAFFPSVGLSALQAASTTVHARTYVPELNIGRTLSEPQRVSAPAEPRTRAGARPMMTLGWVSEDDAPIF